MKIQLYAWGETAEGGRTGRRVLPGESSPVWVGLLWQFRVPLHLWAPAGVRQWSSAGAHPPCELLASLTESWYKRCTFCVPKRELTTSSAARPKGLCFAPVPELSALINPCALSRGLLRGCTGWVTQGIFKADMTLLYFHTDCSP